MPVPKYNRIRPAQLRALVAVAECENFSEAALTLEVSQSAVSHAIATLEAELGVPLLVRQRQGTQLTSAGEGILIYAKQVLNLLDSIVEEAQLHRGTEAGRVRIAAFPTVATHLIPKLTIQFQQHFPKIAVNVGEFYDAWEAERAVREQKADIGFTELPTAKEFEAIELLRDDYIALLPPTAPPVPDGVLDFPTLAAYPIISYKPGNTCYKRLQHYLQNANVSLRVVHEVRDSLTMVNMVQQGMGAAILSRLSAQPLPADVQICQLPIAMERVIGAITLADKLHAPAVFAFLDFLKQSVPLELSAASQT
jgi:DNA-binding transcriptional LysR family regulator